jgi:aspartate racemase
MESGRCLGLIGGLGVGATVHYYEKLVKAHEERGHRLDIVIAHAETSHVFEYVQAEDRAGLAAYLNDFIRRLEAAGAEFAAIPAITPHYCMRELAAISPLAVFDIFDPLNQELAVRGIRRAAVFGTRFAIESALFGRVDSIEIIHPGPDEVDYIHSTYVQVAQQGKGSKEQYKGLTDLALTLCKREGLDAVILAGTDLALLFNETNTAFPNVDCAALHIRATADGLLPELPPVAR